MSDSSWPHGLQPTRLLCPWDFPGKSTGMGCHRLLLIRCLTMSFNSFVIYRLLFLYSDAVTKKCCIIKEIHRKAMEAATSCFTSRGRLCEYSKRYWFKTRRYPAPAALDEASRFSLPDVQVDAPAQTWSRFRRCTVTLLLSVRIWE